jgi:hypothetical protein
VEGAQRAKGKSNAGGRSCPAAARSLKEARSHGEQWRERKDSTTAAHVRFDAEQVGGRWQAVAGSGRRWEAGLAARAANSDGGRTNGNRALRKSRLPVDQRASHTDPASTASTAPLSPTVYPSPPLDHFVA